MTTVIRSFSGKWSALSNFHRHPLQWEGITFSSAEAAFVAAKTTDLSERKNISKMSAGDAKRYGRKIKLRKSWDQVKYREMSAVLEAKFADREMAEILRSTEDAILIEGNTWHDNIWGRCICQECKDIPAVNSLGVLLMLERAHHLR